MPPIGLGTFGKRGDIGLSAMLTALEVGFRHIDTAQGYGNEGNVGLALEQCGLPRGEIFVTTKIDPDNMAPQALKDSMLRSLDALRTGYADLTLIHWPSKGDLVPMADYLEALQEVQSRGQTRHIGVSNFTIALLERAISIVGPGVIANNQVELHPFLQNKALRTRCKTLDIGMTGYMPVAGGAVADEPAIRAIAERHGASPSQIAIAWLLANGVNAIPSSTSRAHLAENLAAADLSLSADDLRDIARLDRGMRIIDPPLNAPAWD